MYSVSYGNGQMEGPFSTYKRAKEVFQAQIRYDAAIGQASPGMRIAEYVDGESFRISGERGRPMPEGYAR